MYIRAVHVSRVKSACAHTHHRRIHHVHTTPHLQLQEGCQEAQQGVCGPEHVSEGEAERRGGGCDCVDAPGGLPVRPGGEVLGHDRHHAEGHARTGIFYFIFPLFFL